MKTTHKPVLLEEVIKYLNPKPGQNFIDCTFGGGGHSRAILENIKSDGRLLSIDLNTEALKHLNTKAHKNLILINNNFKNLKEIVAKNFKYPVNGILMDLGLSSDQLEKSGRGFTFQKDEPLDMRFDVKQDLTATEVLNFYAQKDLYDIFKNLGEYSNARRLSENIVRQRKIKKIKTTFELVEIVRDSHYSRGREKIHPATKVFQALRMEVNSELASLKSVLPQAIDVLSLGGRLVVISFHAGEDRIVKNYFRDNGRGDNAILKILTKKPVVASDEEVKDNPRSRSAKLRAIEKL